MSGVDQIRAEIPMTPSRTSNRLLAVFGAALLIAPLASALLANPAQATGYGIYLDYALGPVKPDAGWPVNASYDTGRISTGLTIDTAVAQDKLFNYRMNLGYEHINEKFNDVTFAKFNGASFENIFGFGVYRSKLMRVWLGPSLRLAAGVYDDDSALGPVPGSIVNLTAGGGLALGVNVHTGDIGSAAFTIGYQYAYQGRFASGGGVSIPDYLQGRDQRVNFNFAYFFRPKGERFEKH
jgi:hypothetical protein